MQHAGAAVAQMGERLAVVSDEVAAVGAGACSRVVLACACNGVLEAAVKVDHALDRHGRRDEQQQHRERREDGQALVHLLVQRILELPDAEELVDKVHHGARQSDQKGKHAVLELLAHRVPRKEEDQQREGRRDDRDPAFGRADLLDHQHELDAVGDKDEKVKLEQRHVHLLPSEHHKRDLGERDHDRDGAREHLHGHGLRRSQRHAVAEHRTYFGDLDERVDEEARVENDGADDQDGVSVDDRIDGEEELVDVRDGEDDDEYGQRSGFGVVVRCRMRLAVELVADKEHALDGDVDRCLCQRDEQEEPTRPRVGDPRPASADALGGLDRPETTEKENVLRLCLRRSNECGRCRTDADARL
ncbi:hypothetical protein L1887_48385 [Cichorium endivia]|nr:hypothetical protein L1887_48385 [Cichorium endivia]